MAEDNDALDVYELEKIYPDKYDLHDSVRVPNCNKCIHRIKGTATCKAFPKRIPDAILEGKNQHINPFPGDDGILFEPID